MLEANQPQQTHGLIEPSTLSRVPVLGLALDGWPEISQYQSLGASPALIPIKIGQSWHIYDPSKDQLLDLGLGNVTEVGKLFPRVNYRGLFEAARGPYKSHYLPLFEDGKWSFLNLTSAAVIRPGIEGDLKAWSSNVAADGSAYVILEAAQPWGRRAIYYSVELQSKEIKQIDPRVGRHDHYSPWVGICSGPRGIGYALVHIEYDRYFYDLQRGELMFQDFKNDPQQYLNNPTINTAGEAFAVVRLSSGEGLFNIARRQFVLRPSYDEIYLSDFGEARVAHCVLKNRGKFDWGDTSGNVGTLPRKLNGYDVSQIWEPHSGPGDKLYAFVCAEGGRPRWQIVDLKLWASISSGIPVSPSDEPPLITKDGRVFFIVREEAGAEKNLFIGQENRLFLKSPWFLGNGSEQEISLLEGRDGRVYLSGKFKKENDSYSASSIRNWIYDVSSGRQLSIRLGGQNITDLVSPFLSSCGDLYAFAWVNENSRALVKLA